jgi:GT2 family glycosyltransferase
MNNFSIVIVTYGRKIELEELLNSIINQAEISYLEKIVLVDNHPERIGQLLASKFSSLLNIDYIENTVNSLTSGRLIGSKAVNSDVTLFLDDDVILEKDYFKHLIKFYNENPNANGMQGAFHVGEFSKLKNIFNRVFWLFNYSSNVYEVYPSIQASYGYKNSIVKSCQWFSGTNFSYKSFVLKEIPFDLRLIKYCEGEDIDFSFRVHKKFGELYINPDCKINHQASLESREIGEEFAIMQEVYGLYLLNKLFPNSIFSKFKYLMSRIGKFILFIIEILRMRPYALKNLITYIKSLKRAYFDGNIDKFNREIS